MINVFLRLGEAELGMLAASGIHSIREWNGFNTDVWSHHQSGINEVWSQTWGFGRLHACVCTSVRRLRKCVAQAVFNSLQNRESAPRWFPFHLSDNIHSSCSRFYLSLFFIISSILPFFSMLYFSLWHTHICTGNDGVIFSSADRKSDEEDQGAVQHLRVVNSNPVSQTHTEMCAHTHTQVQVDSHALPINHTETVNKTEVQLCIQVCSAFYSGYYKLNFLTLRTHKMSESIKGLNYAYCLLFYVVTTNGE